MSRLTLPGKALRKRLRRRSQVARTINRSLMLEQLDRRIVLTGIPEAVCLDASAEIASQVQPAVPDAVAPVASETTASVYLADDGVLQVQPVADVSSIVVRQYVDYQLQEVIEVEVAGQWTAYPVEQVAAVQVQQVSADQQVSTSTGVSVPVQLTATEAVDAVFVSSSADLLASTSFAAPSTPPPSTSNPEGESPSGSSVSPTIAPPVISNFTAVEQDGYWQISGTVSDDKSVAGLTVKFGGLLSGSTATVNSQGLFSITVPFPPDTNGGVTAITTDTDGLQSNSAFTWISN